MKMAKFRDDQQKGYIIYLEFQFSFFPPSFHPSRYIRTGDVYCDGAAALLGAESGGEVIAWLAYGKPPSSIHLSLPFIIPALSVTGCQTIYY